MVNSVHWSSLFILITALEGRLQNGTVLIRPGRRQLNKFINVVCCKRILVGRYAVLFATMASEAPLCTCRAGKYNHHQPFNKNNRVAFMSITCLLYIYTSALLLLPITTLYPWYLHLLWGNNRTNNKGWMKDGRGMNERFRGLLLRFY